MTVHFFASFFFFKLFFSFRGQKLEQSYAFQQFTANVEEEEAWITEKLHLLSGGDYGDTMAAVQVKTSCLLLIIKYLK